MLHLQPLIPNVMALSSYALLNKGEETLMFEAQRRDHGFYRAFVSYDDRGAIQFALLWHNDYLLVIFPYSRKKKDWVGKQGNMNLAMTKKMGGWIHKGFWNQVDSYWVKLYGLLCRHPRLPVLFTGHSRGGACAVLSALRFTNDERLAGVLTFGQPAVVGHTLAGQIENRWYGRYLRYAETLDIVPLIPPAPWYKQCGRLMLIAEKRLLEDPSSQQINFHIEQDNPIMRNPHQVFEQVRRTYERHRHGSYRRRLQETLFVRP